MAMAVGGEAGAEAARVEDWAARVEGVRRVERAVMVTMAAMAATSVVV